MREFVPLEISADEIAERLTNAGLPVDAVDPVGRYERFVTARIVGIEPHPNADRLALCTVDAGAEGTLRIVSGAPNLAAGIAVALALPGARLATGQTVEAVEIRGAPSQGAVVSEREIGLSDDGSGVMALADDAPAGRPLAEWLGTSDTVLDIDVTPNRGDCLSVLGIARELSALTGVRLRDRLPSLREGGPPTASEIRIEIRDRDLCERYVARIARGVNVAPSPLWVRQRLEALGVRAINTIVDVTNYVMLERGQPLHAFDLSRIRGGEIVVRRAGTGCRFTTLDGVERALEPDDLVVADAEGPVALAGVMGGAGSAVGAETRDVLIESAWFLPAAVRRTSRRLGLRSESSMRFERTVDVAGCAAAAARAADLLARIASANVAPGDVDRHPAPRLADEVLVRSERVNQLLGTALPIPEIGQALRRVSAGVKTAGRGGYVCRPPSWRSDLTREADFVEEVARLVGYDRIPETLPRAPIAAVPEKGVIDREARRFLCAEGLTEMVSLRFSSSRWNEIVRGLAPPQAAPVRLLNPPSAEAAEMRLSILPGLLTATVRNRNQGEAWVRAFEVGSVFWNEGGITERPVVAGILRGPVPARGVVREDRDESFYDAKGAVEALLDGLRVSPRWEADARKPFLHPGKSARLEVGSDCIGYVGGVHPTLARDLDLPGETWVFELDTPKIESYRSPRNPFQPLARVPAVIRDLAIVTDESFPSQAVLDVLANRSDLLVESVHLFDVYRGSPLPGGKKSLAYSIAYRASDRTLTDEEVNRLHEKLVEIVTSRPGVEVRR